MRGLPAVWCRVEALMTDETHLTAHGAALSICNKQDVAHAKSAVTKAA